MRHITSETLESVIGEFDVVEYTKNAFKVAFKDMTPCFVFLAGSYLESGKSHAMVDAIFADQILTHWEDYNIPRIPSSALFRKIKVSNCSTIINSSNTEIAYYSFQDTVFISEEGNVLKPLYDVNFSGFNTIYIYFKNKIEFSHWNEKDQSKEYVCLNLKPDVL